MNTRANGSISSRIAIQGAPGSFSHAAAQQLFGEDVELLPCRTFQEAFEAVRQGRARRAVMPVENSLAGPVVQSLDLLWETELQVSAETHVRVELCLATRPGTDPESVRRVASHPVALQQCRGFFERYPELEEVTVDDTAGSIRALMQGSADYDAAICSPLAVRLYHGQTLEHGIEDNAQNWTRFFELGAGRTTERSHGPSAVATVVVDNSPGGLHRALEVLAGEGMDLTQLVARPIPGEPWHYRFHLELTGPDEASTAAALGRLAGVSSEIRVYGFFERPVRARGP